MNQDDLSHLVSTARHAKQRLDEAQAHYDQAREALLSYTGGEPMKLDGASIDLRRRQATPDWKQIVAWWEKRTRSTWQEMMRAAKEDTDRYMKPGSVSTVVTVEAAVGEEPF